MSKFASNARVASKPAVRAQPVVNAAGGIGFAVSPKIEFVSTLLTSFLKDQFYRTEEGTVLRLKELMTQVEPLFAAKAAVYARQAFGMRSISHVVAGEVAKNVKGATWTKDFFNAVCRRADDPSEILAYYMATYVDQPIPNSLKKGLAKFLLRQNEYSLAKYKREGSAFTLIDTVNLVFGTKPYPKKKDGQVWTDRRLGVALGKLLRGELAPADTWETNLTQAGQAAKAGEGNIDELKGAAWASLVSEKKLGYLALIRNLRNIMTAKVDLDLVVKALTDRDAIKKSLVFPFQINTAYEVVGGLGTSEARKIMAALDDAIDLACDNVPKVEGKSVVFLDVSSSMSGCKADQIASIFCAVIAKAWDADVISFDGSARYVNYNRKDSTMTLARGFRYSGGSTNMPAAVQMMNRKYDRILILSDMQTWVGGNTNSILSGYERLYGAKPFVYSFNLQEQGGTTAFPEARVACIAGFSDKVFKLMGSMERDPQTLVNTIEAVEFTRAEKIAPAEKPDGSVAAVD